MHCVAASRRLKAEDAEVVTRADAVLHLEGLYSRRLVGSGLARFVVAHGGLVEFWDRRGRATTDNHCLAYSNAGNIVSPSFVPPGSTILLSGSNLRLSYRTTTMWVPIPRNPPIDRTA